MKKAIRLFLPMFLCSAILLTSFAVLAEPVTVTYWLPWSGGALHDAHAQAVADFNASHNDIQVEMQPVANYVEKLLVALAAGTGPDLGILDVIYLPQFRDEGWMVPLNELGNPGDVLLNMNGVFPGIAGVIANKGKVYAAPDHVGTWALSYNKDFFNEVGLSTTRGPANWEELAEYGKKLTMDRDGDGVVDIWGFLFPNSQAEGTAYFFQMLLAQSGGTITNPELTKAVFNGEAGRETVNFYLDAYYESRYAAPPGTPGGAMRNGNLGMHLVGPAPIRNAENAGINVGVSPIFSHKEQASGLGGFHFFIPESQHKEAAYKFLDWYMQPDRHAKYVLSAGFAPPRRDELRTAAFVEYAKTDQVTRAVAGQLEYLVPRVPSIHYTDISQIIRNWLPQALRQDITVQNALDSAVTEIDAILDGK